MKRWFPLGESIYRFLDERRPWLVGADDTTLIPGIIRLKKASVYTVLSELDPAQRELDAAVSAGPMPCGLELSCLQHACNLYYQYSLWEKMKPVRDRLLALSRRVGYRPGIAQGLYFTGLEIINGGDYQRAIGLFLQALETEGSGTEAVLMGEIYNDIGFCFSRIGDTVKAEEYYRRSLGIREQSGNLLGQAESLSNLGYWMMFQGQPDQAESLLLKAYQLETRIGDKIGAGYTLVNLGYLFFQRAEFGKARECHQRALDLRLAIDDPLGQGHCYLQLRALAGLVDDSREELRLLNKAYHAFVRSDDLTGQVECRIFMAEHWLECGRPDVAGRILAWLGKTMPRIESQEPRRLFLSVSIAQGIRNKDRAAVEQLWNEYQQHFADYTRDFNALQVRAKVLEFLENNAEAESCWRQALAQAKGQQYQYHQATIMFSLGKCNHAAGCGIVRQALELFRAMGAVRMQRKAEDHLNQTGAIA